MAISENDNNRHHSHSDKGPGEWKAIDFMGVSREAQEVRDQLEWLAAEPGVICILITGESGVGKDLAAKILHSLSVNAPDKKNFRHVDCGAFNHNHVRSELFGHVKGSFTGADENRKGCFRRAENGTVFLNEIGNIPISTQGMLLHVLDDHKVSPMGSDDEIEVNPLMIFATNADMEHMVEQGLFRNDLLKRLQFYQLHIPPLRGRKEDIPLIADFLYRNICIKSKSGIKPVMDKGVYGLLSCCDLKGNVRDLENMLNAAYCLMRRNHETVLRTSHFCNFSQKAVHSTMEDDLTAECLTENFLPQLDALFKQKQSKLNGGKSKDHQCVFNLPNHCEVIKKYCLQKAGGNKAKAAIELGITRKEYYKKKSGT